MRRGGLATAAALLLTTATSTNAGSLTVGSGVSVDLGTAALDLGCADLTVGGTLSAGTAGLNQVRDLTINPSGVLNGNSATLEVTGDWDNTGTFNAGTSTVEMVDGCSLASAVIAGNTTFANLEMTTTSGFVYSFTSGSTQTVTSALTLLGALGNLLTIRSTVGGSEAFLDVASSSGDFVDVQDNNASAGNTIRLGPDSVKGPNTPGWEFLPDVPALTLLGLVALAAGLHLTGHRALRWRARADA